jgi:hypothetical protein
MHSKALRDTGLSLVGQPPPPFFFLKTTTWQINAIFIYDCYKTECKYPLAQNEWAALCVVSFQHEIEIP